MIITITGLASIIRFFGGRKPSLKVLAYHRVLDQDEKQYLFDEDLISVSTAEFDRQVAYLAKHFDVKVLSEAVSQFSRNDNRNIVAITFDDGFDDLYFNVFPILKKYGVSATFFLTTGLVGTRETLWPEYIAYAVKKGKGRSLDLSPLLFVENIEEGEGARRLINKLLVLFKSVEDRERLILMDRLLEQLEKPSTQELEQSRMVTWEMVKEMHEYGIEFGSHTATHPVLSRLDESALYEELSESKNVLEAMLSSPCKTIAYPVGGRDCYSDKVIDVVKSLEYKVGCSYRPGVNINGRLDEYQIMRLHVESYTDFGWFVGQLVIPSLCVPNFEAS